jgi:hypothetical protein
MAWTHVAIGVLMLRRRAREALMFLAGGAAGIALLFGLSSLAFLSRSQLPSGAEPWLARLSVAGCLGLGLGLAAGAGLRGWRT